MSVEEEKGLVKVLKWAGIIALIAVPVFMVLKQKKRGVDSIDEDDSNIFTSEFEE